MTATRGEPDCSRIYFVPTLNLFQSSCPVLMQHSAQLTSEWFPPRHQIQYLTHVFCLLIHPPPGRKLCATCVLLWGKWFGVFYRCRGCFSGWHHMASKDEVRYLWWHMHSEEQRTIPTTYSAEPSDTGTCIKWVKNFWTVSKLSFTLRLILCGNWAHTLGRLVDKTMQIYMQNIQIREVN